MNCPFKPRTLAKTVGGERFGYKAVTKKRGEVAKRKGGEAAEGCLEGRVGGGEREESVE